MKVFILLRSVKYSKSSDDFLDLELFKDENVAIEKLKNDFNNDFLLIDNDWEELVLSELNDRNGIIELKVNNVYDEMCYINYDIIEKELK